MNAADIASVGREKMDTSHPMMKMKQRGKPKKWAQPVVQDMKDKGTEGSLTKIANAHGASSPLAFARAHTHDPNPKIRNKSLFAANMNQGR